MATWDDLVTWIRVRYEVIAQSDEALTFRLTVGEDRGQRVYVRHRGQVAGHDWIQVESPIARLDDIDARRLLELAEDTVAGGAAAVDGVAVFRHAAPLEGLSPAQFEGPFRMVTEAADALEHRLTGTDHH